MAPVADSPVSVLIVDDQAPFRRAAAGVVRVTGGFQVAGEAGSGEEAVEMAVALAPQLVLMDTDMGRISGIEASRRITASTPDVVVVLLSTYQATDLPADAATSGALAYLNQEDFGPQVFQDVRSGRLSHPGTP
ncbi:MAG TPA: response regulator transcription factor [Acidimicrobiales bacterium]|nr:response regulator transcription factor [Acidimicrobiales bacterium]